MLVLQTSVLYLNISVFLFVYVFFLFELKFFAVRSDERFIDKKRTDFFYT